MKVFMSVWAQVCVCVRESMSSGAETEVLEPQLPWVLLSSLLGMDRARIRVSEEGLGSVLASPPQFWAQPPANRRRMCPGQVGRGSECCTQKLLPAQGLGPYPAPRSIPRGVYVAHTGPRSSSSAHRCHDRGTAVEKSSQLLALTRRKSTLCPCTQIQGEQSAGRSQAVTGLAGPTHPVQPWGHLRPLPGSGIPRSLIPVCWDLGHQSVPRLNQALPHLRALLYPPKPQEESPLTPRELSKTWGPASLPYLLPHTPPCTPLTQNPSRCSDAAKNHSPRHPP